jgi:hypothetical protein
MRDSSRRRSRRLVASVAATTMLIASGGIAAADNVSIDPSTVELEDGNRIKTLDLASASDVSVAFKLNQERDPGETSAQCNVSAEAPATFSFTSVPTGISAASVTFTTCTGTASTQSTTFTAPVGEYAISLLQTTDVAHISTTNATFTLRVVDTSAPTNTAPTVPGQPSGTSPNDGAFTLNWAASTDADDDPISYTLERKNSEVDAVFAEVAPAPTTNSYAFTDHPEGTWTFRVKASDGQLESDYSAVSSGIVVDRTGPNAPTATATTAADYTDGDGNDWWKTSVAVSFAHNGDPDLADGSAGSGIDPATLTGVQSFSATGPHTASGTVKDLVGNVSTAGTLDVHVDATAPTAWFTSCPSTVVLGSTPGNANWSASDVGSGLATAESGSVALDASSPGSKTVTGPAPADNVGNVGAAPSCTYSVVYSSSGILQPIKSDGSSIFRINSTIPVKLQLMGDSAGYSDGDFTIALHRISNHLNADGDLEEAADVASTSAHGGTTMRYDEKDDQYIFNLGTRGLKQGTYRLTVTLDDGSIRTAYFGLRDR